MKHIVKDKFSGNLFILCDECLQEIQKKRTVQVVYIGPLTQPEGCGHLKGE